jgi:hypothetical protein
MEEERMKQDTDKNGDRLDPKWDEAISRVGKETIEVSIWDQALSKACGNTDYLSITRPEARVRTGSLRGKICDYARARANFATRSLDRYIFIWHDNFDQIVANNLVETVSRLIGEFNDPHSEMHKFPNYSRSYMIYHLADIAQAYADANRYEYYAQKAKSEKGVIPKMPNIRPELISRMDPGWVPMESDE